MRAFVYGADQEVAAWVLERIPHADDFGVCRAIGLSEGDRLIAGVVYHQWLPRYGSIELSMAADTPRWATRQTIAAFLAYPFRQLGCGRVTTCTPVDNVRALDFNAFIGFRREGLIRNGYGDRDMVVCGLLREEAQFWFNSKGA